MHIKFILHDIGKSNENISHGPKLNVASSWISGYESKSRMETFEEQTYEEDDGTQRYKEQ